jgi:putative heme-binding domain-containing protein
VLASTDLKPLQDALAANSHRTNTAGLVEALGHTKDKQAAPLLEPLVNDEARDSAVRRAAVRALAQTPEGAGALLRLAKEDKLPENLKFTAASELASARWLEVKNEAAKVLPLPATGNAEPLPAMAELVKMTGDAARGAQVYRRETVACISCHQVRGEGRDVGPALTEIGSKLPKEALVEAILDPNAGISFGFEAWQVELKSGDEAFGLKVSETADEVAIKDTGGIVTRYKKSDIAKMQQAKNSIMPAGLQATLSTQEFVDLIEYLASLKKAQP